jgi:hypothetical protein
MVAKSQKVKYLQAPNTLVWLSYTERIPNQRYVLQSVICLCRVQQQQQFNDVPLTTNGGILLPPWPPPTKLLFQGVDILLACCYSENLLLCYNGCDIGAPHQIELQSWTNQEGLQGILIAGIQCI